MLKLVDLEQPVESTGCNQDVVALLEDALGRAKAGRMHGVAIASYFADESVVEYDSAWGEDCEAAMMEAVERLRFSMRMDTYERHNRGDHG